MTPYTRTRKMHAQITRQLTEVYFVNYEPDTVLFGAWHQALAAAPGSDIRMVP